MRAAGVNQAGGPVVPLHLADPRPLPDQGCWAELFIAAAAQTALIPPGVPWDVAAAFPVPALTADQALSGALRIRPGETVLVHGGGGVTGGLLVQLAVHYGARVIATGGPASMDRLHGLGAVTVLDYHQPGWPGITGNPPPAERGIAVSAVTVGPDGPRLAQLAALLGHGALGVTVGASFPLDQAAQALAQVRHGAHGTAIVLRPGPAEMRR